MKNFLYVAFLFSTLSVKIQTMEPVERRYCNILNTTMCCDDCHLLLKIIVSDEEAGRCLDPEGNGINPGGGNRGGSSPPGRVQDKQLITSRGGGNTLMEQQGRQEEESSVTKRTHRAQGT